MKLWCTWRPPVWIWVSMWGQLKKEEMDVVPDGTDHLSSSVSTLTSHMQGCEMLRLKDLVAQVCEWFRKIPNLLWRKKSWEAYNMLLGRAGQRCRRKAEDLWKVGMLSVIRVPRLSLWSLRTYLLWDELAGVPKGKSHCVRIRGIQGRGSGSRCWEGEVLVGSLEHWGSGHSEVKETPELCRTPILS